MQLAALGTLVAHAGELLRVVVFTVGVDVFAGDTSVGVMVEWKA